MREKKNVLLKYVLLRSMHPRTLYSWTIFFFAWKISEFKLLFTLQTLIKVLKIEITRWFITSILHCPGFFFLSFSYSSFGLKYLKLLFPESEKKKNKMGSISFNIDKTMQTEFGKRVQIKREEKKNQFKWHFYFVQPIESKSNRSPLVFIDWQPQIYLQMERTKGVTK